jgi:hypothetical protein
VMASIALLLGWKVGNVDADDGASAGDSAA